MLGKPFKLSEVVATVRALLESTEPKAGSHE
jgi:DNA-binding response OmpR family regulator